MEAISGCKAFYLLYNGKQRTPDYVFNETDDCKRPYAEEQLGCSLAPVPVIERLGLRRNVRKTKFVNPTYQDIHPQDSEPWRTLVCCMLDKTEFTLYAKAEVDNYNSRFKPISEFPQERDFEGSRTDKDSNNSFAENSDNPIAISSKNAGWDPAFKLVVNRSDYY